ncbi:hypothetical protein GCM10027346_11080 [Hymenobacter seoulensis]
MPTSDTLNNSFTLDQASDWTRRYREQHDGRVKGHIFSRATLEAILAQPNCEGVRVYYGRDEQNDRRLIMVGIDAQDNDLLETPLPAAQSFAALDTTEESPMMAATDAGTVGPGKPCPPYCSTENTLNS